MKGDPKIVAIASRLVDMGASPLEVAELLDKLPPNYDDVTVYEVLRSINPEVAEKFKREMSLYVWRTDLKREPFNKKRIVDSIVKEAGVSKNLAEKIAREVEEKVKELNITVITSTLIRELALLKFLEYGMEDAYRSYSRLGIPVYDVVNFVKEGKGQVEAFIARRVFAQYALLYLMPRELAEYVLDKQVFVHSIKNPFVPYTSAYVSRSSQERWYEGLSKFVFQKPFVERPSIMVPDWMEEEQAAVLKHVLSYLKPTFWTTGEVEGVEVSDMPLYFFGKLPEKQVLDKISINVERMRLFSPTHSSLREKLEAIKGFVEEYEEKRKAYVKASRIVVEVEGDKEVTEDVFDDSNYTVIQRRT